MTIEEAIHYLNERIKDCEEGEALEASRDEPCAELLADWCYEREACELALAALREKQDRMECRSKEKIE